MLKLNGLIGSLFLSILQICVFNSATNFLEGDNFVHNAIQLISKAAELNFESGGIYMDIFNKMIHSIFFLWNIHHPQLKPEEIFNGEILELLNGPIEKSRTEVAVRTPFSYFLELVVSISENDQKVKDVLTETLQKCKGSGYRRTLISQVICICRVSGRSYYGGSLSCPTIPQREIMTAVSCFHVWDSSVSSAVLSVFPEARTNPLSMKLPSSVQCRAYAIGNLNEVKAPCLRCHELYSLPTSETRKYKPGNCAETEAISNLLRNEPVVKNDTRMKGGRMTDLFIRKINDHNYRIDKIYEST
ncbi:hypothetical protein AMEX_G23804 [Astyanax mexicanus]|uniref:Uncharacterized protein n=1 Tax=Astyanax mexicanus TaxID=7994 RepID=A0A8T2KWL5_ASTMX|nr:hypothetical protein AMEX_G23804 [Astyanax mexicanus]